MFQESRLWGDYRTSSLRSQLNAAGLVGLTGFIRVPQFPKILGAASLIGGVVVGSGRIGETSSPSAERRAGGGAGGGGILSECPPGKSKRPREEEYAKDLSRTPRA